MPEEYILIATVQTAFKTPNEWLTNTQMVFIDECFPKGTLVGNTPIEDIQVGDFVPSFNHVKGVYEDKRVLAVSKTPAPTHMAVVKLSNGVEITSTVRHPYATPTGYKMAGALNCGIALAEMALRLELTKD